MAWTTPKTDWVSTDTFEITDFNRIKNNLEFLSERVKELVFPVEIQSMGADMTSYNDYWKVSYFNAIESNLDTINECAYNMDYGNKKTFFVNSSFITWDELNRIESATLDIYNMLNRQEEGLRRLPFTLGRYREVRI